MAVHVASQAVIRFVKELRRRRVFRVAGLYVVAIWLLMQAANILFPAWEIPDRAISYLLWAGLLGFPVALVFGWVFDISAQGIRRTQPVSSDADLRGSLPLRRADYLILGAFLAIVGAIAYDTTGRVRETATFEAWRPSGAEIEPHSLAVLPFANLSADPDQEYFADGISEEILNRLAAFRELRVIARTSSFAFKDSGYDIGRISGILAVNYLLQGSVRRDGERLRIATQLVDRQGVQVWASSFDRELGAIFALQEEIAEAVATSIVPQIVPPAASAHHTPDLKAYQEFLIGQQIMASRPSMFYRRGAERFSRAIELDPDFAAAYAARAVGRFIGSGWAPDRDAEIERVRRDIERALELNPELPLAHAAMGLLEASHRSGDLAAGERSLRRALELDPNLVDGYSWLANILWRQGREDAAGELLRRAEHINPLDPEVHARLALLDAHRGRFEAAERRLLRLLDVPQPSIVTFSTLQHLYRNTGRLAEEVTMAKRMILSAVQQSRRLAALQFLARAYAWLGMGAQADYWLDRFSSGVPDVYQMRLYRPAILGIWLRDIDWTEALAEFQAVLDAAGVAPGSLFEMHRLSYATLLTLAGEHERAVAIFESMLPADPSAPVSDVQHLLAWIHLERGELSAAHELLAPVDMQCRGMESDDRLHFGGQLAVCALNAQLAGRRKLALERLTRAVDSGWCGYYELRTQPWWQGLRDQPEFQALMARIRATLDEQRAQVEAADAVDDFEARLDAALALAQENST
jgi:TolB-like protein